VSTSHLRYLLAAGSAATIGLLAACGSAQAPASLPGTSSSIVPPASPPPASVTGLAPSLPGLTDRLVLRQTHVRARTVIQGELIVTYRGRSPITLRRPDPRVSQCRPKFAVVVTNHRIPPQVGFTDECGPVPFAIKPGENRLAFTVSTTYLSCTNDSWQVTSSLPACPPGQQLTPSTMPPLPAGRYLAILVGDGLPLPAPAPVPVTIGAAS
jgi:hypothetical protein